MIAEGFLLGLSTGTYCMISCAPVAIPFIFSEEIKSGWQNAIYISLMLVGRLIAYISVGLLIGAVGGYAVNYLDPVLQRKLLSYSNTFIGLLMIATGVMYNFPSLKLCRRFKHIYKPEWGSFLYGLFTGFNVCPPIFYAAARVFGKGEAVGGMFYFLMFFLGTSIYFTPLFGVHLLKKHLATVRMIARMTLIILGIYFLLVQGLFLQG
ncbi:MAG: sulfite exporter TauE/SafE family protein [bacterium]|nr:sulfite exporter TauE/SafE family protein [bacterium]